MNSRWLQKGSAHVIVIAVLVVALAGTLGLVFYQNFIAKPSSDSSSADQQDTDANASTLEQIAFNSDIYEISYPEGWKLEEAKTPEELATSSSTNVSLLNEKKTVKVTVRIAKDAFVDDCDPASGLKISYYKVNPGAADNLVDAPLRVVEAMIDHDGGGYDYKIGLTPEGGATNSVIGDPSCNVSLVGVASNALLAADGVTLKQPTISAIIEFPKLPNSSKVPVKEMQPVRDMLATDDYKTAKAILESLRKK